MKILNHYVIYLKLIQYYKSIMLQFLKNEHYKGSCGIKEHKTWEVGPPWLLSSKESACKVRGAGSIPVSGKSPGEGRGLGNPRDRGTWWATVHGVGKVGADWATRQGQQRFTESDD